MSTHVYAPHNAYYKSPAKKVFVPATDPQVSFLTKLMDQRVMDAVQRGSLLTRINEGTLSKSDASDEISYLKNQPWAHQIYPTKSTQQKPDVKTGYYTKDDEVFQVVKSAQGNLYAKRLTVFVHPTTGKPKGSWVYEAGLIAKASTWDYLTIDKAEQFGQCGVCAICGRTLTHPDSVARGIGPICAGKV